MKYKLLTVIILMFCFCCACADEMADSGQATEIDESLKSEDKVSPSDSYTFPPDDEDFACMLKESGMGDWYIQERPDFLGEPDDSRSIHLLSSDIADCIIFARHKDGIMDHGLDISLGLKTLGRETPNEDYKRFETEELPKIWTLAGNIIDAQEDIEKLRKECMSYYYEHKPSAEERTFQWEGRHGKFKCFAFFGWNVSLQRHVLHAIWIDTVDDF